jgi:hypothetical protein
MKFTIATGILTQALPAAISEKSPSSKLLEQDVSNENDFASSRTPESILPRGRDTTGDQMPQFLDGLLKNIPFARRRNVLMKACDPSSNDPDIGILSCDAGYECVFDQDSTLGGHCTLISRDLQEHEICYLCGDGMVMDLGKTDIALQDPHYYVGLTCTDLFYQAYSGCYNTFTGNATSCVIAGIVVQQAGCCVPPYNCNLCGEWELMADAIPEFLEIPAKCGFLVEFFNDTLCPTFANDHYITTACCDFTTAASSFVPDTPSPPSTSSSACAEGRCWSSSTSTLLVSSMMMSLTIVTAAGSLL